MTAFARFPTVHSERERERRMAVRSPTRDREHDCCIIRGPQLSNLRRAGLRPRLRDVTATKELISRTRTATSPDFLFVVLPAFSRDTCRSMFPELSHDFIRSRENRVDEARVRMKKAKEYRSIKPDLYFRACSRVAIHGISRHRKQSSLSKSPKPTGTSRRAGKEGGTDIRCILARRAADRFTWNDG